MAVIDSDPSIDNTSMHILTAFCIIFICPMLPRCIIGMRELYDSDIREEGLDNSSGVASQPISSVDDDSGPVVGIDEEIQLELVRESGRENKVGLGQLLRG